MKRFSRTVLGVLLLSQQPSLLAGVGCSVTVGAVVLAILAGRRNR